MRVTYRDCSSAKCHLDNDQEEKCKFQYKIQVCQKDKMVYVYSNKENHLNLNIMAKDKLFAIHIYYKVEIERLLPIKKQPMKIYNQILLNANANQYDPSVPLPEYSQIKTFISNLRRKARDGDNEYAFVAELLKTLEYYEG